MKKKRVLEVFIVETKGGLMFSHKDISGKTTLYDSYKLTTITEISSIDEKRPEPIRVKKPATTATPNELIDLCGITYHHSIKIIKKNKIGTGIISYGHRNIPKSNGGKIYTGVLMSTNENKIAATKIIKQALLDYPLLKVTGLN